ncbi:hypothetical protein EHO60_01585 [Leptospira fletcheri]|uniref:Uncharacterized protein n=1 Tax=Leptospira fletcheri TaxID=2484981 RepID=A0A4R9GJZ2_9LEPT|nr:histidine kinase N-terminal 7TM domain-containing protein [Leptospira fletcheri]TGK14062.1 hypothetical protein EHO60_01585 [Leptospira fletcheri]
MDLPLVTCIAIGSYVAFLGIYIHSFKPAKPVQKYFLVFCLSTCAWVMWFAIRLYFPDSWRAQAINWTAIPAMVIPFSFYFCAEAYVNSDYKPSCWVIIPNTGLAGFLLYKAFRCELVDSLGLSPTGGVVYSFTPYYHVFVIYISLIMLLGFFLIARNAYIHNGTIRVNSVIFAIGGIGGLAIAVFFIYILPLLGIFAQYLASIGVLFTITFWAGILNFDAFEIKSQLLSGEEIPFLLRAALPLQLALYRVMDPAGYKDRLLSNRADVTFYMLLWNHELTLKTNLEPEEKARLIAEKFERYLK